MRDAGLGYQKISKITGVPHTTIRDWIRKRAKYQEELSEFAIESMNENSSSAVHYHDVQRMYSEGHEAQEISTILQEPYSVICEWIATFASSSDNKNKMTVEMPKDRDKVRRSDAQPQVVGLKDAGDKSPASANTSESEQSNEELLKRIKELEKQLARETMRADVNEKIIELAEKKFNIPIRKK